MLGPNWIVQGEVGQIPSSLEFQSPCSPRNRGCADPREGTPLNCRPLYIYVEVLTLVSDAGWSVRESTLRPIPLLPFCRHVLECSQIVNLSTVVAVMDDNGLY